uniref:Uncharacterized protein n=1 Tax=Quercus lobata TaxID=97700 RepID=A0A7N2MSJ3_QUELO
MIDQNLSGLGPHRSAGEFRSGGFLTGKQNLKESYGGDDEDRGKSAGSPNRAGSETQQETKKTKAEKRQRFERRLVKYEELPEYLRDNEPRE